MTADGVTDRDRVAGLLLAAGAGRRMGGPKALVRAGDGTAWVTRSAHVLAGGGCDPLVVVLGAGAERAVPLVPAGCRVVVAPDWAQGMGASLRAGLGSLTDRPPGGGDAQAVVVGLVDTPGVTRAVVARLVALGSAAALARAAYAGVPGHPVLLGRDHWAGVVSSAQGDAGAREHLRTRDVLLVECGDVGDGTDVDGPESFEGAGGIG